MGKFIIRQVNTGIKFDLKADNNETIATSEVYNSLDACKNGIESVRTNAPIANIEDQTEANYEEQKHPKFEVYRDNAAEYRFRLKAANGQIIAVSEGYNGRMDCLMGIRSVQRNAAEAKVLDRREA